MVWLAFAEADFVAKAAFRNNGVMNGAGSARFSALCCHPTLEKTEPDCMWSTRSGAKE
jgi:hypothetical protein